MKLDDTVCRGSLIIHNGETRVVTGLLRVMQPTQQGKFNFSLVNGFKTCRVVNIDGVLDYIIDGDGIATNTEVDSFFPGVCYVLPDYIK